MGSTTFFSPEVQRNMQQKNCKKVTPKKRDINKRISQGKFLKWQIKCYNFMDKTLIQIVLALRMAS